MKGIVFTGDRSVGLQQFPDPVPGPGEVVLQMKASGMCGTDLKLYRPPAGEALRALGLSGSGPIIAGHEPCGVVAEVGVGVSARKARIGQRVMVHHYRGCGACAQCSTGWQQLCEEGVAEIYGATAHGGHAQFLKVPASTLVDLPDSLTFEAGAAISCGTGTAWGALQRLEVMGDQTIAVFGQGPVGLSVTLLAAALGARVIALDISPARLQRAREFGAHETINPGDTDAVAAIKQLTRGLGAHCAVEASSSPQARQQAVRCLRTWGKACLVGEGGQVTVDVSPDLIRRQASIIGHWTFNTVMQADCARFIADRRLQVDPLFTDRWTLDQAKEAYELFDQQISGKGVFVFEETA